MDMRVLQVVAAVITHEGKVFCAQRHKGGDAGGKWEFPGGKVEKGETNEDALKREIREELKLDIEPLAPIATLRHAYPDLTIDLHLYLARLKGSEEPTLTEHLAYAWKSVEDLEEVDWADADRKACAIVQEFLEKERSHEDC